MQWRGLVTISLLPPLMLLQMAGFVPFSVSSTAGSSIDVGQAFQSAGLAPDPEARRKVIVVPGLRLWGEAQIDVCCELDSNFGKLIREMQERVRTEEGIVLQYQPAAGEEVSEVYFSHDTDFIPFSYTGRPVYWSHDSRRSLKQSSRLLSILVTRTRELYPNASLDLVGYSLGGLVVLYWAQHLASPEDLASLHSILLVATPVRGVTDHWLGDIYRWFCRCPILYDIREDSPAIRSLTIPGEISNVVVVNSVNDWIVNGNFGDGLHLDQTGQNVLMELRYIGEPVRRLTLTSMAQIMRNHTMILRDEPSVSEMAQAVERLCAQNSTPNGR